MECRKMRKLVHQKQPTPNSCTSTCIAMIRGVPAAEVIGEFHDDYVAATKNADEYLKEHDITATPCLSTQRWLMTNTLYMLGVPSLNLVGGTHSVIADLRDGTLIVLGPNEGLPGKRYYTSPDNPRADDELAFVLKSFFFDYEVEL